MLILCLSYSIATVRNLPRRFAFAVLIFIIEDKVFQQTFLQIDHKFGANFQTASTKLFRAKKVSYLTRIVYIYRVFPSIEVSKSSYCFAWSFDSKLTCKTQKYYVFNAHPKNYNANKKGFMKKICLVRTLILDRSTCVDCRQVGNIHVT